MNLNSLAIAVFFLFGFEIIFTSNFSESSSLALLGFIFLIVGVSSFKYRIEKRAFQIRNAKFQDTTLKP